MNYSEKIAKLRKENNLTQEQFSELLHVSRQSVSKWELGKTYPDTEKLIEMGKLFSCSLDYLLKEEIENKDVSELKNSDHTIKKYMLGLLLTYLSFPPLFGFIVGICNIIFQKKSLNNKKQILLSSIGIVFSLILTSIMVCGVIFNM